MKRKLLTALASTAGLAAVAMPAMCMTSCATKSHIAANASAIVNGEGTTTFTVTFSCPSIKKGETAVIQGLYWVWIHEGVRMVNPFDWDSLNVSLDSDNPQSTKELTIGDFNLYEGDKIGLACFAYCGNTITIDQSWTEFFTANATVQSAE